MKTQLLACLVVIGVAAIGAGASAAEPDISGSGVWQETPHHLKDPGRKLYIALSEPLGHAQGRDTNEYAFFDVWGKVIYEEPQRHGEYGVAEEWVAMRLDCATLSYKASRYQMLDSKGKVLVDAILTDRPKRVRTQWDDPDHMKLMQLIADLAGRDACNSGR